MYNKIKLITICFLVASCGATKTPSQTKLQPSARAKKPTTTTYSNSSSARATGPNDIVGIYIDNFKNVAMNNMRKFGIPASIVLAQGILESGAGKSELTQIANNHFGIKCNSDWQGEVVKHDDDKSQECFRKYNNSAESYDDHARFLTGKSRYASLFDLPKDDYVGWANGLRAAGYATDPMYPQKLITSIERYELRQYDAEVLGKKQVYNSNPNQGTTPTERYHVVEKGDTLYSLSRKYNVSVEELVKKNNIQDNILSLGQNIYY